MTPKASAGHPSARTIQEELTSLWMGSYTLQESESIADAIGYMGGEIRWG